MKHGYGGYTNGACRCDVCSEAQAAYAHRYKQRPGVRERQLAYQANYREQKREEKLAYGREYKLRNSEQLRAKERAFRKTPQGLMKARRDNENRRARKLGQFLEDVDPEVVYRMHGGCCGICKEYVPIDDFHVDHVVALARGGSHGYVNVQPAHPRCNLTKWVF